MAEEYPYRRIMEESLKGELRVLNAHLPNEQKPLAQLLEEEIPAIACKDGTAHLFKRKELNFLAGLLDEEERAALMLPVLIEVNPDSDELSVVTRGPVEEKVISSVLGMPVTTKGRRITIYRSQLAAIRKQLRTATQYLFTAKLTG